jgi:hypothetical protein
MKDEKKVMPTPQEIAKRVEDRFNSLNQEVERILGAAEHDYKPIDLGPISFQLSGSAPRKTVYLPEDEVTFDSFLRKLNSLPSVDDPHIEIKNGSVILKNDHQIRAKISECRPIFSNQNDSIYYTKVHGKLFQLLKGTYDSGNVKITVISSSPTGDVDKTEEFISELNARKKIIGRALELSDLDYLYNGVLQHADPKFSQRYQQDYLSGELNYLIWKNGLLLENLLELLRLHTPCLELLWYNGFPKPGSM